MAARKAKVSTAEENALAENGVSPGAEAGANRDRGGVPKSMPLTHAQIVPDALNARKSFDPEALAELAETMATHGLLQPLVVAIDTEATAAADPGHVHFQLVAGERRWRAWGLLIADGRWSADHTEDCRIETADERNRMEAALIENLQRVDLNHMEAGEAFELLGAKFHLSNKEIAAKIGRTPEYVQQHRRLTQLPESQREAVRAGDMTLDEAREVLRRPTLDKLTLEQRAILIEALHHITLHPAKTSSSESAKAECFWTAGVDGDLQQLRQMRLLEFTQEDYRTHRAYIHHAYGLRDLRDDDRLKGLFDKSRADAALKASRTNPLRDPEYVAPPEGQTYFTPWLNGPFDLSAEAKEKIALRAKIDADAKARREEHERKAEETKAARALVRAQAAALTVEELHARIAQALAGCKRWGPFKAADYGAVRDAEGRGTISVSAYGGEDETLGVYLAALFNHIAPDPAPEGAAVGQDQDDDDEDDEDENEEDQDDPDWADIEGVDALSEEAA